MGSHPLLHQSQGTFFPLALGLDCGCITAEKLDKIGPSGLLGQPPVTSVEKMKIETHFGDPEPHSKN